jgi:hypothetical protein
MNVHSGKTLYKKGVAKIIDCNKYGYAHILPLPTTKDLGEKDNISIKGVTYNYEGEV